jgi:hypothetical protein
MGVSDGEAYSSHQVLYHAGRFGATSGCCSPSWPA